MNKKIFFWVLLTIFISFFLNVIFGNWVVERLALLPLVKKYEIIKSRTPLVINTREEVRISDTTDLVAISNKAKDKLAALVDQDGKLVSNLVAISSDGWYLVPRAVSGLTGLERYSVVTEQEKGGVEKLVIDTETNLAFLKSPVLARSVMPFALPSDFQPGQKLALVALLENSRLYTLGSTLASEEYLPVGEFTSEQPGRTALLQSSSGYVPGQAVVNVKGDLVGFWSGSDMVTVSVVQEVVTNFLANGNRVVRPVWGFNYRSGVSVYDDRKGFLVLEVDGIAKKSGLVVGDIILEIDGKKIDSLQAPDFLLTSASISEAHKFKIYRNNLEFDVDITPESSK